MDENITLDATTGAPLGEISQAPPALEAFLDKHQMKLIALAVLLTILAIVYVIVKGINQSNEETAGALLTKAEDLSELQTVVKNHGDTQAAFSAKVLLAEKQWEDGQQDDAISTLKDFVESDRDHPARPVLVVSNDPDAGGLTKAQALDIPIACVDHKPFGKDRAAFEAALQSLLEAARPDILCLAGFMRILTPEFTAKWDGRMLNIHPSLLPKYKGLHTHARALAAGDAAHGCSVHQVTAALDDGPILGQAQIAVGPDDTADTLAMRLLPLEHALYPAVLRRFAVGDYRRLDLQG